MNRGDTVYLTIRELAKTYGIGEHKLREILPDIEYPGLKLRVGNRMLVRRDAFDEYLKNVEEI